MTVAKRRKPGRPPLRGRAMTPAERKRAQRARDARAAIDAIGAEEKAPLKALTALLGRAEKGGPAAHAAKRAWRAIGRRMGWIE